MGDTTRPVPGAPGPGTPQDRLTQVVGPPSAGGGEAPPAEVAAAPRAAAFGRFVRVSRLGSGGMGEVYKSWDPALGRWVALKILRADAQEVAPWFQREARLAAQLSHPGLVAIHEVGEVEGRPYIAMQFVEGRTLDRAHELGREERVMLVRDAAAAIGVAHEAGIVHRDLKPENLIVESRPVAKEGQEPRWEHKVCVLDFGVARAMHSALRLTAGWAAIGTPLYMAPEQARGEPPEPASDVYSLGATLYEALVGAPPIRGDGLQDTMNQIQLREPVPLRAIDPSIPESLEAIVNRCLAKNPRERYPNGNALAEDLGRHLRGESVQAGRTGVLGRARSWARRRAGPLRVGTVLVATVSVAAVWGLGLHRAARASEDRARRTSSLAAVVSACRAEAWSCAATGDADGARAAWRRGLEACRAELARGDFPEGRLLLAEACLASGDADAAEKEAEAATIADPGLGRAAVVRGLARALRHARLESRRLASIGGVRLQPGPLLAPTREELDASFPELPELRAAALRDLGQPSPALPGDVDGALVAGVRERLRGHPADALRALQPALAGARPAPPVLVQAIEAAMESADASAAAGLVARAVPLWPGDPAIRLASARFQASTIPAEPGAERDRALQHLAQEAEHAARLGAVQPDAALLLAAAQSARGLHAEAEQAYSTALAAEPGCVLALMGRADSRARLGRAAEAAVDAREAVRRLPESSPLRTVLLDRYPDAGGR